MISCGESSNTGRGINGHSSGEGDMHGFDVAYKSKAIQSLRLLVT